MGNLNVANPSELPDRVTAIQEAVTLDEVILAELQAGSGLPLATDSTFGVVKPDSTTITVDAGVISAAAATVSAPGIVQPDNATLDLGGADGTLELTPIADVAGTYTAITSITINGFGRVTAITGT